MAKQPTDDKLDKVRNLLFGAQAEETDRKTKQLEQRLTREGADLRKQLDKRLSSLEDAIRGELDALHESVLQEKAGREVSHKELSSRITDTTRAVGKRVTALQEQTAVNLRDQRRTLTEQIKALRLEAEQARAELGAEIDESLAALGEASVAREDLARMFTDLAAKLSGKGGGK